MLWQNATVDMDPDHAWAQWTYEYAICYMVGPFIGAFLAGTVFNHMKQTVEDMENGKPVAEAQENSKAAKFNGVDDV